MAAALHAALITAVDAALPQTQCTRCGYADCAGYAAAIVAGEAPVNRCPPGGQQGVERLAAIVQADMLPLDPAHGVEAPRTLALIDEAWCIGCTLCLAACPVDAIVGAAKQMHVVLDAHCTGCELCVPVCPVDCISLVDASGTATGWNAWSPAQAERSRERYRAHRNRVGTASMAVDDASQADEAKSRAGLGDGANCNAASNAAGVPGVSSQEHKRDVVASALERSRSARAQRARR